MIAVASATNVYLVKRAVAAVMVILAVRNVASNAEIYVFHVITSVKLLCARRFEIILGY